MATWESNVAAGGIRFPQAWPVAQAESFPFCVLFPSLHFGLRGSGGQQGEKGGSGEEDGLL